VKNHDFTPKNHIFSNFRVGAHRVRAPPPWIRPCKPPQWGPSWPWSYGSWIYNHLCNQCLSPLMLRVRTSIRARCTTLCDKVCQWLATGRWFSPGSSTNKTDRHDITEILLKVALNTIKQTNIHTSTMCLSNTNLRDFASNSTYQTEKSYVNSWWSVEALRVMLIRLYWRIP
jgi:hypothetical protein